MTKSSRDIELIEQYLSGKLQGEDLLSVQERVSVEADFKEKLEDMTYLFEAMDEIQIKNLQQEAEQWEAEIQKKEDSPILRKSLGYWKYAAIAAGILLLLAVLPWGDSQSNKWSALAQENYSPLMNPGVRNPASPSNSIFKNGTDAFEAGELDQAIGYFSQIKNADESYSLARYYLAHCYFQKENFQQAHDLFSALTYEEFMFQENAQWNRLLAAIALKKDKAEIQLYLKKIMDAPQHNYSKKAKELLDTLD